MLFEPQHIPVHWGIQTNSNMIIMETFKFQTIADVSQDPEHK